MNEPINLLVVDDDEIYLYLIKALIRKIPLEINLLTAKNGVDAGKKLEMEKPDLILLDINMPVMNGWKFLDLERNKLKNANLYIVTSSIDPEDQRKAAEESVVKGFLEKPITEETLHNLLKEN